MTCVPQTGHVAPLVPFAEVLAAQGDEVVIAAGADAADAVDGLPSVCVPQNADNFSNAGRLGASGAGEVLLRRHARQKTR